MQNRCCPLDCITENQTIRGKQETREVHKFRVAEEKESGGRFGVVNKGDNHNCDHH